MIELKRKCVSEVDEESVRYIGAQQKVIFRAYAVFMVHMSDTLTTEPGSHFTWK